MNVIPFQSPAQHADRNWRQIELQELIALYSSQAAIGNAGSWDVDATEMSEPQFYLLAPGPEHDCIACISRVGRLYVLEDGAGMLVHESSNLNSLTARAAQMLPRRRAAALVTRMMLMLCAVRAVIDEKLEPLIPDSTEMLVRIVPPLAAII